MLHPAPTTKLAPHLARGTVVEHIAATATKPAFVVLGFANTSYKMHLEPTGEVATPVGKTVIGTIRAEAKRVDVVTSGGRFVEPVFGRPRQVQGAVLGNDGGVITVHAGVPIVCTLSDPRQKAEDFAVGDFVGFAVSRGATFTPEG